MAEKTPVVVRPGYLFSPQPPLIGHSGMSRILFGEFQCDAVDHLTQSVDCGVPKEAKVGPIEGFAVANGAFGGDFDDEGVRKRADKDFEPAVFVSGGTATKADIIATDASSPALLVDYGLEVKTREVVAQPVQAAFDVFGEFIAEGRVTVTQLFFRDCVRDSGGVGSVFYLQPALDGLLKLFIKIRHL